MGGKRVLLRLLEENKGLQSDSTEAVLLFFFLSSLCINMLRFNLFGFLIEHVRSHVDIRNFKDKLFSRSAQALPEKGGHDSAAGQG